MMEDKAIGGDRISNLPLSIIHHILSFLPNNNDVKLLMSVLSKTWYHISSSFPYLVFNDCFFGGYGRYPPQEDEDIDKYLNYVSETLVRFRDHNKSNLKIQRLTIPITFRSRVAPVLDFCIELALQHGVKEFNLHVRYGNANRYKAPRYDLPHALFAPNNYIKVAKFEGYCSFLNYFPNDAPNNNLLKLCLDNVLLDEQTLSSIISTYPLMEELSILSCYGMRCVSIFNLDKLKTLQISCGMTGRYIYTIDIIAPSLQSLEIQGPVKIQIVKCPKLTRLDLRGTLEAGLENILSSLPSLLSLSMLCICQLTKLKMSSYTLKNLEVFKCQQLVELDIDAPNLLSVIYKDVTMPLPSLTKEVKGRWEVSTSFNLLCNLTKFGSMVKHIEYLELYLTKEIPPFSFKKLNNIRPFANINHLELCVRYGPKINYPNLLDGALWRCHPHALSLTIENSIGYRINNIKAMKDILKIIARHRHCCSCTPARSWLHHLEDVMYVNEDGSEEQRSVYENYLPHWGRKIKFSFRW